VRGHWRWAEAATLETVRMTYARVNGVTTRARELRRGEELLREAARTAGEKIAHTAEERGMAMTLETAVEFLLIVTEAELRSPTIADNEPQAPAAPDVAAGLSDRERELVTLVAQGRTDAQIAGQLFISVSTVRSHLDRIRDKTSCRRRADLTRLALRTGLA
jgi:DNA-binding CsgD family transcriptional regulator